MFFFLKQEPAYKIRISDLSSDGCSSDLLISRGYAVSQSIHDFHDDPRNERILIWVNGALKPRAEAVVSVFDSGFVLGDGVWEGLRVAGGHPLFLDEHLDRLFEGARAIAMDIGLDRTALTRALYDTLAANGMEDGVHLRLMV